jgi:hypothetical protein
LKKALHKKEAGGVAQGVGPEFKSQYRKKDVSQVCSHLETWLVLEDPLPIPRWHTHVAVDIRP